MKYRINNIIKTLTGLPKPQYKGQVSSFPMLIETWEYGLTGSNDPVAMQGDLDCYKITVKAVQFQENNRKWLEWVMDI